MQKFKPTNTSPNDAGDDNPTTTTSESPGSHVTLDVEDNAECENNDETGTSTDEAGDDNPIITTSDSPRSHVTLDVPVEGENNDETVDIKAPQSHIKNESGNVGPSSIPTPSSQASATVADNRNTGDAEVLLFRQNVADAMGYVDVRPPHDDFVSSRRAKLMISSKRDTGHGEEVDVDQASTPKDGTAREGVEEGTNTSSITSELIKPILPDGHGERAFKL